MNEAQVRTLEQVCQVLAGTQALEFQATADDGNSPTKALLAPVVGSQQHLT